MKPLISRAMQSPATSCSRGAPRQSQFACFEQVNRARRSPDGTSDNPPVRQVGLVDASRGRCKMSEPIVFISRNRVKKGKLDDFKHFYQEGVERLRREKPGT